VFVDKLHCHYLTRNSFCSTFINQVNVVQLQARGPHMAHHSVFSGPRKHSGKIFKCEICRQAYEVTFASLNCLRWIKSICTKNKSYLFCVTFCFTFLFYDQIRRYGPPLTLHWGTCLDNLCYFSATPFVVLKSTSGAMNSIPPNKSIYP